MYPIDNKELTLTVKLIFLIIGGLDYIHNRAKLMAKKTIHFKFWKTNSSIIRHFLKYIDLVYLRLLNLFRMISIGNFLFTK